MGAENVITIDGQEFSFTTGETITEDQRGVLRQAFSCPVLDQYGQGEGVFVAAHYLTEGGYHEMSEMGVLECVKGATMTEGNGTNRVLGTSLLNTAMPFIRFDIGDLAIPATDPCCPCGRGLPIRITKVVGRIDDQIQLSSRPGDLMLPVVIRMQVKPFLKPGQSYQLLQHEVGVFELRLVGKWPDSAITLELTQRIQDLLGGNVQVSTRYVSWDEIQTSGGKIRNVISLLRN